MESDAALGRCIKHCLDCGIRFLAAPQNAGREDLRCPFGCARRHRARQSNERVKAYRRTKSGKQKKGALNARRYRRPPSEACPSQCTEVAWVAKPTVSDGPGAADSPPAESRAQPLSAERPAAPPLDLDGLIPHEWSIVHSPMLPYIRTLIAMLDGVWMSHGEVVAWLREVQRQRSMLYRSRREYVLCFLHQHPP